MSSPEELELSHKKALKSLDGEKRAAIKKAKGVKGKKGKDLLAAVEEEFATKIKALESSYEEQLSKLGALVITTQEKHETDQCTTAVAPAVAVNGSDRGAEAASGDGNSDDDDEAAARERKLAKARKKREKQKEKEAQLQKQIVEETANAGPSMRQIELEQIEAILSPLSLTVREVEADGHCLYRAVAAQSNTTYTEISKPIVINYSTIFVRSVARSFVCYDYSSFFLFFCFCS
jgi:OTU domain-containing protein 6